MKECYVFIYLPGQTMAVPAGIFSYDPAGPQGIFQYGHRYLEREDAVSVDPVALPLDREPLPVTSNDGLYGAFRDASPDYWGRTVIAYDKKIATSALDEVDYLLLTNASRVGNLDFRQSLDDPEPQYAPPSYQAIGELIEAAQMLQQNQPIRRDHEQLLMRGTSIGGARPKCTTEWNGELWIAKFPSRGDPFDNARVEYATMTLARRCGINVADIRLQDIGGRDVLMVRRFDRESMGNGYGRTGFVSALSFMEWDQEDRAVFSYVSIADRMRQAGLGASLAPQELYRRMAFNVFCRNTDDHPRNHGFLIRDGKLELSPAYDITPSAARIGVGSEFSLAMELGTEGRNASLGNLLSRHAQFGLRMEEARDMLSGIAKVVSGWEGHFLKCGVTKDDTEKFRGSFDTPLLAAAKSMSEDIECDNGDEESNSCRP